MKSLCIDLFCGLGGWSEGFLAEGYECRGYDIEAHDYGTGGYPGELILRDVRSITGVECKDAVVIVASPPCQAYSYRAMPWKRAKALPPPDNTLFNECFRIQREASEAAGRYIPLIVENVCGAQKWVGRARWNYGSFYLWGDVPALMPMTFNGRKLPGNNGPRLWTDREVQRLCDAGKKGIPHRTAGHRTNPAEHDGVKRGITIGGTYAERKARGDTLITTGSKSKSRKAASAMIAKIPFPLSSHIARCFKP